MTTHKITVGSAPDFVMHSGATDYRHGVTISFKPQQGKIVKHRFSHLGLSEVIKEIHEKLAHLECHSDVPVEWGGRRPIQWCDQCKSRAN